MSSESSNYSMTVRNQRLILVTLVPALLVMLGYCFHLITEMSKNQSKQIYVVGDQMLMSANRMDEMDKTHLVAVFGEFWMKLAFQHDQFTYKSNLEKAMKYITPEEGNKVKQTLQDAQVLEEYIESNSYSTITLDSVAWVSKTEPYQLKLYQVRHVNFGNGQRLPQDFTMMITVNDVPSLTDDNDFGLIISDWKYIER